MGYSRRQRFGDGTSALPRVEFSREFLTEVRGIRADEPAAHKGDHPTEAEVGALGDAGAPLGRSPRTRFAGTEPIPGEPRIEATDLEPDAPHDRLQGRRLKAEPVREGVPTHRDETEHRTVPAPDGPSAPEGGRDGPLRREGHHPML